MFFNSKKSIIGKYYFPCKRDWWIGIIIWGIIIWAFYNTYANNAPKNLKGIMGFIILFIGWIWFRTGYMVADGFLVTWSGPFRNKVPAKYISSISRTRNILFAPTFSINALKIQAGRKRITVAPKDKKAFINALLTQNPNIKVDESLLK